MAAVYPIPTTRSSGLLMQTRLMAQLQSDQLDILRLTNQISTGRRISKPSEDAPAALRAQSLQRLLELKAQAEVNLKTSQSYLDASDSVISGVAKLLSDIRGTALSVADTTSSDSARLAAAEEVRRAIEQLTSIGNHNFRGRYLFAGSRASLTPFSLDGNRATYNGNEGSLSSFVDIDLPYATNVAGSDIFGTFSPGVQGAVDLNPVLTHNTLLSDLRGGAGVTLGSIAVSDGATTQIIDISGASTIGDIAELIAANPPAGRTVTARVTATGLWVDLDNAGGGNLTIREVGGGTTAAELGILNVNGAGTSPIVGSDLNPRLRLTTSLADILGRRAITYFDSPGADNALILEARQSGAAANGISIQFVDDDLLRATPGLTVGNETASYSDVAVASRAALALSGFGNNLLLTANTAGTAFNGVQLELVDAGAIGNSATANYNAGTKTLTLGVDSTGATQVQTLVNAINAQGTFSAAYDPSDASDGGYNPASAVQSVDIGLVTGNTGNSGGAARTIFVNIDPGATTANHVVAAIAANADLAPQFDLRIDPSDSSSLAAAGSGIIDIDATGALAGGSGEPLDRSSGLQIVNGGETHVVRFDDAQTVEDLLNALNGSSAQVLAEIDPASDRIVIRSRLSGTAFHIGENGGTTAAQLGVRSLTEDTLLADLNYGRGVSSFTGTDFTIRRKDGVALDIDVSAAQSIGDVLDLVNGHPLNLNPATRVVARLAAFGNGIELVDENAGGAGTLEIETNPLSQAAWDLGLLPRGVNISAPAAAATFATASLAFGPPNDVNTAIVVTAAQAGAALSGVEIVFESTLVGDVAVANYNAGLGRLTISLDATQTTANTVIAAIQADGTFGAALDTSFDPTNDGTGVVGATGQVGTTAGGLGESLTGTDSNPLEVAGAFNSLARLHEALVNFDVLAVERAIGLLDLDFDRVNFARAEIGARGRSLETLQTRLEDEDIHLRANLSGEIDTDLPEAISNLTARQAALEASLRLTARTMQLSLLDFL